MIVYENMIDPALLTVMGIVDDPLLTATVITLGCSPVTVVVHTSIAYPFCILVIVT